MSHHFKILPNGRTVDSWCQKCEMWRQCESPRMDGEGSKNPVWFMCGEAPGATEDEIGQPFVGEAGQLLRAALESVGFDLEKVRFSNVVMCRPKENNLKKWPKAADYCKPHILREIHSTNPKVVVLFGNTAIKSVLNKNGILKLHGEVFQVLGRSYVCCFHPAYLMRNDTPKVRAEFREALKTARRIGTGESKSSTKKLKVNVQIITDKKMLYEYVDLLEKQSLLTVDIEGSTLSSYATKREPKIGCVGFGWTKDDAVVFSGHSRRGGFASKIKVRPELIFEAVKQICENKKIKFVAHFGKYDYCYLAVNKGIWIGGKDSDTGLYADTGLMSYSLNERKGSHGLKDWAYKIGMAEYDLPKRQYQLEHPETDPKAGGNMLEIPCDILYDYNGKDCIADYRLYAKLEKKLKKENLFDLPFMFPLMQLNWMSAMLEIHGLNIDRDYNSKMQVSFPQRIEEEEKQLRRYPEVMQLQKNANARLLQTLYERVHSYKKECKHPKKKVLELYEKNKEVVNLNSPDVKRELLYDILEYRPTRMTPSGEQPSVDKLTFEDLKKQKKSKILTKLIQRSELESAFNKYVGPIPDWILSDGRSHSTYRPQGTLTGRVSSDDPNHENLPKRGRLADELRKQFTSSGPEYWLVEQDEKQVEMRLFADRANDKVMIGEFEAGKDPHAMGAMTGFGYTEKEWYALPDKARKSMRDFSKSAISFGLLYGRHAKALALSMKWSIKRAQDFIDKYFGKYRACLKYRDARERYIKKYKRVISHFFRVRRLPEVDTEDFGKQAAAVREGINSPIQGDASDLVWIASYRLQKWLLKHKMKSKVVIIVHDAMYVDTHYSEMKRVVAKMHEYMTDRRFIEKRTGWYCRVLLDTDVKIGPNLAELEELKMEGKPGNFIIPKKYLRPAA